MLAIDAHTLMGREGVNQLPVISEGKFEGMGGGGMSCNSCRLAPI
jgi:hypothetical protein